MFSKAKHSIRNIFFAGLLVTLPLAITIFFLRFLFIRIDAILGPAINELLVKTGLIQHTVFLIPGIGLVALIIIIFVVGLLTKNIIGSTFVKLYEGVLVKIPIFKNIYVGAKQVLETFGNSLGSSFNKVVMIEYPREGIYALAFITGESKGEVKTVVDKEMVNVFLPTTPNPTSGFFLLIPKTQITELEMTVEEGIKMIISGGLVTPPDPGLAKKPVTGWDGHERRVNSRERRRNRLFTNKILKAPVSLQEMTSMSFGHEGIIKIVADIKTRKVAAGAKWHSESRDILVADGSRAEDCWGAKINVEDGTIAYESQINKGRPGAGNLSEIVDQKIREEVSQLARQYFPELPA
ncbi:MAG: DUF502 domain-containing protein [Nitrospinota bacterium]|nr:DUF502 domain-containing protein [Nitrospinota bacterium]